MIGMRWKPYSVKCVGNRTAWNALETVQRGMRWKPYGEVWMCVFFCKWAMPVVYFNYQ